jgi:hypothetical protein
VRDALNAIDPRWRNEIQQHEPSAAVGGLNDSALAAGAAAVSTLPGTLQAHNYLERLRAAAAGGGAPDPQRGVSPGNESAGAVSASGTARSSPPRSGNDLLRAAMYELEQSDRIVLQLVGRCELLEEELGIRQQEMTQLRDVNRRLSSEYADSQSADARRFAALDECRISLERRLMAVEADRDKLLNEHNTHRANSQSQPNSMPVSQPTSQYGRVGGEGFAVPPLPLSQAVLQQQQQQMTGAPSAAPPRLNSARFGGGGSSHSSGVFQQ